MVNNLCCVFPSSPGKYRNGIELVDPDGCLRLLQARSISAGEITTRYSHTIVAHADSFYIGEKVAVLSVEDKLEAGQSYFLLPEKMSRSVLSAAWLGSLAAAGRCSSVKGVMSVEPFQIEQSEDGGVQLKIVPQFIQKLLENGKMSTESDENGSSSYSGVCSTLQLQKDYIQLVKGRDERWRPKLETIVEKKKGCKLFAFKRKYRS